MKFARVRTAAGVRPVVVAGDVTYDLSGRVADLDPQTRADIGHAVRSGDGGMQGLRLRPSGQ